MEWLFDTQVFLALLGIDQSVAFWILVSLVCFIGIGIIIGNAIRHGTTINQDQE